MRAVLRLVPVTPSCQRLIFGTAIIRRLIDCASRNTGIAPEHITGCSRDRDLVWTRWAIAIVAREHGRTVTQIAECFGRDHTTILYGLTAANDVQDQDFWLLVAILRDEVAA